MASNNPLKKAAERLGRFLSRENVDKYYTLKRELGCGNFSIVRLCVRKEDGKEFAVKIIEKKRVGQKKDMLETEVEILKQVDHPHVVHMEAMFETPTHLYLVMELVPGGELFDLLVDRGSFNEKEASGILKQVIEGVAYLHSLGIAHRDLKPENLLCAGHSVTSDIKISDFGLSKVMNPEAQMKMTTACGTPGYVAPEVLKLMGYGKEVDLWSIGVITYILLCGFPPFYDDSNAVLFEKIMSGNFSFPAPYWSNISNEAKDFISKLLCVDPVKRMTCEQALAHPWITGAATPAAPIGEHFMTKFKEFNKSRKAEIQRPVFKPDPTSTQADAAAAAKEH
jgi:calcium/calmodulin-dependent protein kinase I